MQIYDLVVSLVGTVPTEFEFIYSILTLIIAMLIVSFLFSLFYLPLKIFEQR